MRNLQIFTLVMGLLIAPAAAQAQPATPARPANPATPQKPQVPTAPAQSSPGFMLEQQDARQTRDVLNELLNQYPPSVREVLRIDPTLLYRADYIGTYPRLAAFLEQHPEIAHNPTFFIGERRFDEQNSTPATEAFRAVSRTVEHLTVVMIIGTITLGIVFLVRTAIEHRRWQRTMKAQSELHSKLIDRFSSSDDLIAYLQSPAGKAMTDTPALPQVAPRPMSAPLGRIFWSLQSGIVVSALGAGLMIVSGSVTQVELYQFLRGVGIVVLMIGIGFSVSAGVSFILSQRLGLVQSLSSRYGGEAPGS